MQLKSTAGIRVAELQERLRKLLPQQMPEARFSFEPNDIVSKVMSFGAPSPIEVAVSGPDFKKSRAFAEQIRDALATVPTLRDLAFEQELDYPALKVDIDRQMAGMLGVTADQIGQITDRGDFIEPIHSPQFLARSQQRHRLSGTGPGAAAANELARRGQEHSHRAESEMVRSTCAM